MPELRDWVPSVPPLRPTVPQDRHQVYVSQGSTPRAVELGLESLALVGAALESWLSFCGLGLKVGPGEGKEEVTPSLPGAPLFSTAAFLSTLRTQGHLGSV